MQEAIDPQDTVHVARQPILHRSGRTFAYELLYRSGAGQTACTAPVDLAGACVLNDAVLTIGLGTLTGGLPAFVNLTRQLLVSDAGTLLPRDAVVLELLEDIPVDSAVIDACRRLRQEGYTLALDDFVAGSDAEGLLPYATFVKVDVLTTPAEMRAALAKRLVPRGVRLIAEKVETLEMAKQAAEEGYRLFQGYFFCRPTIHSSGALLAQRLAYVNLLGALQRPDLSIDDLEELVKRDVSLG
jgi:EAL and modified HD-GYP domain-containing signal transduction protein